MLGLNAAYVVVSPEAPLVRGASALVRGAWHYFTGRYSSAIERPGPGEPLRSVEIRLGPDGRLSANGWPALTALEVVTLHGRRAGVGAPEG